MKTQLFIDIFAPKTIDQITLLPRISRDLSIGIDKHIIFHGSPGLGKSLLAKVIAKSHNTLYINASLDGLIDTLREEVTTFCETISFESSDKPKLVIFDEIDGVKSAAFIDALRAFMDTYGGGCLFLATCNNISKITRISPDSGAAVLSRFETVNFNPQNKEEEEFMYNGYKTRISKIILACKMVCPDPNILDLLCKRSYPDYRGILQTLQKFHKNGIKTIDESCISKHSYSFKPIYDIILSKAVSPEKIYEVVNSDYSNSTTEVFEALTTDLIEYIKSEAIIYKPLIPQIIIKAVQYAKEERNVPDITAPLKACLYEISFLAAKI